MFQRIPEGNVKMVEHKELIEALKKLADDFVHLASLCGEAPINYHSYNEAIKMIAILEEEMG